MSDLLVGCRVEYTPPSDSSGPSSHKEGIVVKVDRNGSNQKIVWIIDPDGIVKTYILDGTVKIHPDDVKFIYGLNKDHKARQENIENKLDRFEILDL